MALLDNIIEEKRIDVSVLSRKETKILRLEDTNMYFQFLFDIDGNYSYHLMIIRGLLLNLLDVLSCSPKIRRVSVGDVRVPTRWMDEAKRIFYDTDTFRSPINIPFNGFIFEIYMDVDIYNLTIPEILRIMCSVCQLLRLVQTKQYSYLRNATLFNLSRIHTNYKFEKSIELFSSLKSRHRNAEEHAMGGLLNSLRELFEIFDIPVKDIDRKIMTHQIKNFVGRSNVNDY